VTGTLTGGPVVSAGWRHSVADYPPRETPASWPETIQPRDRVIERLLADPFWPQSRAVQRTMRRGLPPLLAWLERQPGRSWQDRWLASGAEEAGPDWSALPVRQLPSIADQAPALLRKDLKSAIRLPLCGQVLRPSYSWLLRYRPHILLVEARRLLDPRGFARLRAHCQATGRRNSMDVNGALNRITWILLRKGGRVADITVGDCIELDAALAAHCGLRANRRPLFYALLVETGILPTGSPPILRAARLTGQRSPAELVAKYQLTCAPIRELLVSYLTERAPEVDHATLVGLAYTLCGLFWKDLEQHHPGINSLHLPHAIATGWKQRLSQVRDTEGRHIGARVTVRDHLLVVRAFYTDLARWAAEDPARWSPWVVPSPIKASECSLVKDRKRRKAAMDQRTRARLPALPTLVDTAERERKTTRIRLDAALAVPVGDVFNSSHGTFHRLPADADRVFVTDLATGRRRDLTFEEERAFWAWASIEVLRHTGIRIEEMMELTHHSFVAYKLPTTGEIVPMLQVAPSKTDTERVLLVSPELGEVLAAIVHRVRAGRSTLPVISAYDPHERTWSPAMPFLFLRPRGPVNRVLSHLTVRRFIGHTIAVSGLTDSSNQPLLFTPHDFRRMFATDALRSGLPPHIAARILGHTDLGTTMGYAAIYPADVITHHRAFIARRRELRPSDEYRDLTPEEWDQFLHHFELRKVALGVCTRDFGTPCVHEHSCVRCPLLRPDPGQMPRLLEIRDNLQARIAEARQEGWLGEIAGLEATLAAAKQKLETMRRLADRNGLTHLGMPDFHDPTGQDAHT